ncbi:MAG: OmpH family outer membrane protein [Bacteroidota bacterium]
MTKMLKIAIFSLFLLGSASNLMAQKFGYVNSALILSELPAVRAAEADLEALQKQLTKRGEDMVNQFRADVAALEQKVAEGGLSRQINLIKISVVGFHQIQQMFA